MEHSDHTTDSAQELQCNPRDLTFLSHRRQVEGTVRHVPVAELGLFPELQTEWKAISSSRNSMPAKGELSPVPLKRNEQSVQSSGSQNSKHNQTKQKSYKIRWLVSAIDCSSEYQQGKQYQLPLSRCQLSSVRRCGSPPEAASVDLEVNISDSITGDVDVTHAHKL